MKKAPQGYAARGGDHILRASVTLSFPLLILSGIVSNSIVADSLISALGEGNL